MIGQRRSEAPARENAFSHSRGTQRGCGPQSFLPTAQRCSLLLMMIGRRRSGAPAPQRAFWYSQYKLVVVFEHCVLWLQDLLNTVQVETGIHWDSLGAIGSLLVSLLNTCSVSTQHYVCIIESCWFTFVDHRYVDVSTLVQMHFADVFSLQAERSSRDMPYTHLLRLSCWTVIITISPTHHELNVPLTWDVDACLHISSQYVRRVHVTFVLCKFEIINDFSIYG